MRKTKRQIEDEKYGGRSLFDLIELEFSQGEDNENEQDRELSKYREVATNAQRNFRNAFCI